MIETLRLVLNDLIFLLLLLLLLHYLGHGDLRGEANGTVSGHTYRLPIPGNVLQHQQQLLAGLQGVELVDRG